MKYKSVAFLALSLAVLCALMLSISRVHAQTQAIEPPKFDVANKEFQAYSRTKQWKVLSEVASDVLIYNELHYANASKKFPKDEEANFAAVNKYYQDFKGGDPDGSLTDALVVFTNAADDQQSFKALLALTQIDSSASSAKVLVEAVEKRFYAQDYVSGVGEYLIDLDAPEADITRALEKLYTKGASDSIKADAAYALARFHYRGSQDYNVPLADIQSALKQARFYADDIVENYVDVPLVFLTTEPSEEHYQKVNKAYLAAGLPSLYGDSEFESDEVSTTQVPGAGFDESYGDVGRKLLFRIDNLSIGQKLPKALVQTMQGKPYSLDSTAGNVMILDFWATWCAPCIAAFPSHAELVKSYAGKPFSFLAISVDNEKEEAEFWLEEKGDYPFTFLYTSPDKGVAKEWGIEQLPTSYIVDHNGIIRAIDVVEEQELKTLIAKLVAEIKAPI